MEKVALGVVYAAPLVFGVSGIALLFLARFSAPSIFTAVPCIVGSVAIAMRATLLSDRLLMAEAARLESRVLSTRVNRKVRRHRGLQARTRTFEGDLALLRRQIAPVRQPVLKRTYRRVVISAGDLECAASKALADVQQAVMLTGLFRSVIARVSLEDAGRCRDRPRSRLNRAHAPPPGHQVATQPVCPHGPPRHSAAPPECAWTGWLAA